MANTTHSRIEGSQVDLGAALAETAGFKPAKFAGFEDLTRRIGEGVGDKLGFDEELSFEMTYTDAEEMRPELMFSSELEKHVNFSLKLAPFGVPGILSISKPVFYCWLELAMGGARNAETVFPERSPTHLEFEIGRLFCKRFCEALFAAFRGISTIKSVHVTPVEQSEGDGLGQWLRRGSQVCIFYEAKLSSISGEIALILPMKMLIPLRAADPAEQKQDDEPEQRIDAVWDNMLRSTIETTRLDLDVVLGRAEMTLGDMAGFHVGQLIRLEKPTREPIVVEAADGPVFSAALGLNKGRYMLKFEQMIETNAERLDELSA